MASLQNLIPGGFNAATVEPKESRDYSALPAGLYTAEITGADVKQLKSGNGTGLSLEFTIIDPEPFAKRKVWQQINIVHTNEQAQQIGQSELSALCRAVGIGVLNDSDDLFQRMVRIRTRVRKQEGYDPKAEVTGYEPAGAGAPPVAAPNKGLTSGASAPWKKKAA